MSLKVCRSYFNGFPEIFKKNNTKTKFLASLKILSYFTILIPLGFGAAYGYYALKGRMNKKTNSDQTDTRVKNTVKEHFPDSSAPTKPTVNVDNSKPQQTSKPVDSNQTVNSKIFQTEESKSVHSYTGDLTADEKSHIKPIFVDDFKLKISFEQFPKTEVTIRREDIFNSGAEVIVNAANDHLGGGGGIDGLIHSRGGEEYVQAHKELRSLYRGKYVLGHAAFIESGLLKEKYKIDHVIVVAGPSGNTDHEKETELYSCYYNSLILAHEKRKERIAIPSISTGIFGFPKDRAAAISLKALHDFLNAHKDTTLKNISIHFLPKEPREELERFLNQ